MSSRGLVDVVAAVTPVWTAPCRCGRGRRRPGQRTCRECHAEDMRERRALAIARGTYTVRGCQKRAGV